MEMKTPEGMAEEYADRAIVYSEFKIAYDAFLVGYQAGKEATLDVQSRMDGAIDRMFQRAKGNSPEKPDGWISVKERLTKKNILILCCSLKSLSPTYGWFDGTFWNVNDEPNYLKDKIDFISFITHWMPLPKPPEE